MSGFEMTPPSGGLGDVERRAGVIARARRIAWAVRTFFAVLLASFALTFVDAQGQLASEQLDNVGAKITTDADVTGAQPTLGPAAPSDSFLGSDVASTSNPSTAEYALFGLGGILVLGGIRLAGRSGRGLSTRPSVPSLVLIVVGGVMSAIGLVKIFG